MMGRWQITTCAVSFGLAGLLVTALCAHPDDPKEKNQMPRYEGPGYRADLAGPGGTGFDSLGISLLSWLPIAEFGDHIDANDCWGYVSGTGREYGIIGLRNGTGFVEVTDPGNAQVVGYVDGPTSLWRDIKTFGQYAYAVTEGGGGIQILDLADIDNGNVVLVNTVDTGGTSSTHNVAINTESGYLYRCGGSGSGIRMYDLNADPTTPAYVGEYQPRYTHDCQVVNWTDGKYAGRELAFLCGGFNGGGAMTGLTIVDVTDKALPVEIAHYQYPDGSYSHQGWLSDDRQHFYLDDELDDGITGTHVIDISDLAMPVEVNTFSNGSGATDHNLYVLGDLCFQANYTTGLRVWDVADPMSPSEVAYFDTHPESNGGGFGGMWSNYPYLPSGVIIASDRIRGMFVLQLDAPPTCDITGDNIFDVADLLAMLADWGPCPAVCPADLNGNGIVDVADLLDLLAQWGPC